MQWYSQLLQAYNDAVNMSIVVQSFQDLLWAAYPFFYDLIQHVRNALNLVDYTLCSTIVPGAFEAAKQLAETQQSLNAERVALINAILLYAGVEYLSDRSLCQTCFISESRALKLTRNHRSSSCKPRI